MKRGEFVFALLALVYIGESNAAYLPERPAPMEKIEQEFFSDTTPYLGAPQGVLTIPSTAEIIAAEALAPGLLPSHLKYTTTTSDDDHRLSRRIRNSNEAEGQQTAGASENQTSDGAPTPTTSTRGEKNTEPTMATTVPTTTKQEQPAGLQQDQISRPAMNWQTTVPAGQQSQYGVATSRVSNVPYGYGQRGSPHDLHPSAQSLNGRSAQNHQLNNARSHYPRYTQAGGALPAYQPAVARHGHHQAGAPRSAHQRTNAAHHKPATSSKHSPSHNHEAGSKNPRQGQPAKRSASGRQAEDRQIDPYGADVGIMDPNAVGMGADPSMFYEPSAAAPRASDAYSNPNVGPGCVTYEMAHQPDPCGQYAAPVATSAL